MHAIENDFNDDCLQMISQWHLKKIDKSGRRRRRRAFIEVTLINPFYIIKAFLFEVRFKKLRNLKSASP